ncbi:MAG: hypothetical protein IT203_10790 [Fimbriimonadaceae bacterium]|nr:hypothetical protein [Fimbriimonadaceae bacterium]
MNIAATRPITLAAFLSLAWVVQAQDKDNQGKFSGLIFGDYYSVLGHNDSSIKGKEGFWIRRINLVYDRKIGEKLTSQIRMEAKDPGDFSTSQTMDPYLKDAWVRYTENGHKITFGLIPTPTWGPAEDRLGYRPIERTPFDLYKLGNPRDKGISVQGPLDKEGKAEYMLMVGDGSGTKSSNGNTRTFYGRLDYKATPEISFDLYGDSWKKDADVDWSSVKAEAFYQGKQVTGGISYSAQKRTKPGDSDVNLNVVSVYGEFKASDKFRPFVRYDYVSDAVPDADKIEYIKMSKDGKPSLFLFGVRCKITDQLEVVPSLETVTYRRGEGGLKPSQDSFLRVTVSVKF